MLSTWSTCRMGATVKMVCQAHGGNPLAQVSQSLQNRVLLVYLDLLCILTILNILTILTRVLTILTISTVLTILIILTILMFR